MKNEKDFKPTNSLSEWTALFNGVKRLDGGKYAAKLGLLSGQDEDGKQRFLNGSFLVDEALGQKIQFLTFANQSGALRCKVKIGSLHCVGKVGEDGETVYMNYRGFLNGIEL